MGNLVNIEAEQSVLGAILTKNDALMNVGSLRACHFSEPLHQRLFTVLSDNFSAGVPSDPVLISRGFDNDVSLSGIAPSWIYLSKLVGHALSVIRIAEYAELVIDLAQRRALSSTLDSALVRIADTLLSPAEIASQISTEISESVSDIGVVMFEDDYEITEAILCDMKKEVIPYKTGYSKLDEAMGGGMFPGKSYGFAARKKVGKTILAGSISSNLNIAGVRHLFICGEMSPAEIQKRTLARLLRTQSHSFTQSSAGRDSFMKKIAEAATTSKRSIIYKNAPGLTFEDLKRYVMLARMQKKITGFILDYWQLVGGKPKNKSTAEHLDEVAQWIADTCRKYDLWSITMAQINQEGNTRGGEGIRLAFDQVYTLQAPNQDPGRRERWLEMSDTRYTPWRSIGSQNSPGFYLNEKGPYFSETADDNEELGL